MKMKPLPQNENAEGMTLSMIVQDPQRLLQVSGIVSPDDFYTPRLRTIYEVMLDLSKQHRPIDVFSIQAELKRRGNMDEAEEFYAYQVLTMDMIHFTPTPHDSVLECARLIRDASLFREAVKQFTNLVSMAWNQDETMLATAIETVHTLEKRSFVGSQAFSTMGQVAAQYIEKISYAYQNRGTLSGITTGYHDINRLTEGWQNSDLIILAARPGHGKTTFSLCLGVNAAQSGCHIGYFTMEMNTHQIFNKLVAMGIPMNSQMLMRGYFDDQDWAKIVDTTEGLTNYNISFCEKSGLSIQELSSLARTLHANDPLDMIIVDYLQLMHAMVNGKRMENRQQEVTEITQGLKNLARDLNIPVIALAQLNRSVETRSSKVPMMSDLRESGSIEQEADIIMFLYRDDENNPESERKGITDVIFAKHRNGATGEVSLLFDKPTSRFRNLEILVTPEEE